MTSHSTLRQHHTNTVTMLLLTAPWQHMFDNHCIMITMASYNILKTTKRKAVPWQHFTWQHHYNTTLYHDNTTLHHDNITLHHDNTTLHHGNTTLHHGNTHMTMSKSRETVLDCALLPLHLCKRKPGFVYCVYIGLHRAGGIVQVLCRTLLYHNIQLVGM